MTTHSQNPRQIVENSIVTRRSEDQLLTAERRFIREEVERIVDELDLWRGGSGRGIAITLDCNQGAIKLLAEDVEGNDTQNFTPGGQTEAQATAKAKSEAETKAKNNAKAEITKQQNETKCGSKCPKKDGPGADQRSLQADPGRSGGLRPHRSHP